ncbi:MAG: N-acetyl-gamma-glutamyl-phosphate reductase [Planctomycetota bacterium]
MDERCRPMVRVKIVGAGGYGGIGLIELLCRHPEAELAALVDVADVGKKISDVWPHLKGFCDLTILKPGSREAASEADVVFFATPDGVGQTLAAEALKAGEKVIDYSGDFRFSNASLYAEYARRIGREAAHVSPELLEKSVYGLPELHRKEIRKARIVGNPGCFAISCILGLAPAVKHKLVEPGALVCDCKTGVSGAGKTPRPGFHYPERYDNTSAYKLLGHQHVMEIERELSRLAGETRIVAFTPQVVPMARGILSTLYGRLAKGATQERALEAYHDFYAKERFVRVFDQKTALGTSDVRETNFTNLQVACDERTGAFRVVSHIDNLVKGQAGNALQNMNLLFGLDESLGLDQPGCHP